METAIILRKEARHDAPLIILHEVFDIAKETRLIIRLDLHALFRVAEAEEEHDASYDGKDGDGPLIAVGLIAIVNPVCQRDHEDRAEHAASRREDEAVGLQRHAVAVIRRDDAA